MTDTTLDRTPETGADRSVETLPPGAARLIGLLLVSAFVVILNETIMSVALPRLMVDFSISATSAQWITTAFLLTMAVVIPTTGYLMSRFTLRQLFITAMTVFSVGTLLAAVAPVFPLLVAARVVQASGTAVMMPLLITTVLDLVPASRRGQMMGRISIVISVAPAIGPTVSGLILSQLSWRWMFWCVLPIALVALALGATWVRNVGEPTEQRADVLSVVASVLAFAGLVYGLTGIGEAAAGDPFLAPWIPLTVGAVALVVFVARQLQLREHALLDLRTFATPSFRVAVLLVVAAMMGLFGTLILLPILLQDALGLSVLQAGLVLLPGGATMAVLAPSVGRLFDRFGPRPLVPPGAALAAVALWLMSTYDASTAVAEVVAVHVLLSAGIAFMFTPLLTSALGSLPPHLYSHGSATVSTIQMVAGAAGTALFVTVYTRGLVAQAEAGTTGAVATAAGVSDALLWGGVVATVAFVLSLFVRGGQPVEAQQDAAEEPATV